MTIWAAIGGVGLALAVNECCELSPWAADKVVRWSAHLRYSDPEQAQIRAEELSALIMTRPGKLFKLITALAFAASALRAWTQRAAADLFIDHHSISTDGGVIINKTVIAAAACATALAVFAGLSWGPSGLAHEPNQIAEATQLNNLRALAVTLSARINGEKNRLKLLDNLAADECYGDSGPGLTGIPGYGPNCRRDHLDAATYEQMNPVGQQEAELNTLRRQIQALQTHLSR